VSEINADDFRKNFFKMLAAILVLVGFVYVLSPLFIPIVLGGILAMAFSPYLKFFTRKGWSRKLSLILMTVVLFLMCITPVGVVIVKGTKIVSNFLSQQSLAELKQMLETKIYGFLDRFSEVSEIDSGSVREKFGQFVGTSGAYALNLFSSFLGSIPNILMLSFITILSFYFCLLEEDKIRRWFDRYFYFKYENGDRFIQLLKSSCQEVFFANVLTGVIQATVVGGGAFFTQTGDFFIVFIITFFLSFIPVIGAAPTGFVVAAGAFFSNRIGPGIAMACVAAFSGIIDNFIRPYLNSRGSVEVPAYVNFLAIIGGVITIGLAGLFVGPLMASLTYGAIPIILEEWFPVLDERIKSTYKENDKT
jgi:predicted PurR-regulated permease PerM